MKTLLAGVVLLWATTAAAERDAESVRKWREDVATFRTELPRRHHRDFFFNLPRAEFDRLVNALDADIPKLEDHEIKVRLAEIVARLGDRHGHTRVSLGFPSTGFHILPLDLYLYSDGLFIRSAAKEHADAVGARVISIGGTPADEALRRVLTVTAGDNDFSRKASAQVLLTMPEVLRALRVVRDGAPAAPVSLTIRRIDGKESTITVAPLEKLDDVQWIDVRSSAKTAPLYRRYPPPNPSAEYIPARNFWFHYLADEKVLYVNYSAVMDTKEQTLEGFFREVFAFADSHAVEKFVIDVRYNGGGNNMLNRPIIHGLIQHAETIGKQGRLFALIGRTTFSAAQNFVNDLDEQTPVTFVGEPTGGSPNHYGDSVRFTLPNSRVVVRAATLWWQDSHPQDPRSWVAPHIAAELSSADDREGRDPALEAVLRYTPEPSLTAQLREAIARGGKAEAAKVYRAWRDVPARKYREVESEINDLAATLFGEGKGDQAVAMFELNAELHPRSWQALEGVGRAYAASGKREAAIAAFEHALKINPNAGSVMERLERLKQ